jgi:hypothetical protein
MIVRASALLLLAGSCLTIAQTATSPSEEIGDLVVDRTRITWVSPESVVRDLRSDIEDVRLRALRQIGVSDRMLHVPIYSDTSPAQMVGQKVNAPLKIELLTGALGDDSTQHVIVAADFYGAYTYAALAVPRANGWERIAVFNCWCKYEKDPLREFVQLEEIPHNYEHPQFQLVLRASLGGTGIYRQTEARFRMYRGSARKVLSFMSRERSCPAAPIRPCEITFRWFNGRELIEAAGTFDGEKVPAVTFLNEALQSRYARSLKCTPFVWDAKVFRYKQDGAPGVCKTEAELLPKSE